MKYSGEQLRLRRSALQFSGSIESNRWRLAALAAQAEDNDVPGWGEIISLAVRRSPSTIYEWRKAWRLRKSVNPTSRLSISFWVTASNAINHVPNADIMDWLTQCEEDETITLESARANFPRARKPDKELADALDAEADRIGELRARPDAEPCAEQLEAAQVLLRTARLKLIGEPERETA